MDAVGFDLRSLVRSRLRNESVCLAGFGGWYGDARVCRDPVAAECAVCVGARVTRIGERDCEWGDTDPALWHVPDI